MEPVSMEQLAAWAGEARGRWSVPGLAVGVLRDGEVVVAADGVRELGRDDPVTPDGVFRVASITKPFTATLAMTLVQDGLLDLDAPASGEQPEATIRQLLSHQGGLACERPEPIDEVGLGELFSYSNAGFWLVGATAARACGTSYEEAMQARVLDPLALDNTGYDADGGVSGHNPVAPGRDEHRRASAVYPRARRPSGGLWSTVADLLRFAAHHLGASGPLTPASVAELQRPASSGPGFRHGLGWFLTERGGRLAVEHFGSAAGYQSVLVLVPGEQVAVAVLTNSSRGTAAIRDLLDRLGLSLPAREEAPITVDALDVFAGRYEAPGVRTHVERVAGRLRLTSSERDPLTGEIVEYPPIVGRPIGDREFEVVDGDSRGEIFGFVGEGFLSYWILLRRVE
jgi:CubicO group peptidase (beta-lactamase class C family)